MELLCYVKPGWAPRIRPASSKRSWMDETADAYAYRCLPLNIANAHGWEILSPCGFEARWTGAPEQDSVEIRADEGGVPREVPVSLFGHGTITFHVDGIFRTPPGWNLWVGGSPNAAKDGIAPLSGIVETDWSPYTFTMNWRFTRPGQWIRFEENEPFCFLFLLPRNALEEVAPRLVPIEDAPELAAQFEAWSVSRDAFQARMEVERPVHAGDSWQKLYYRGVLPDGSPGAADHQAKLRLAPFTRPDGAVLETASAVACPVRRVATDAGQAASAGGETALRTGSASAATQSAERPWGGWLQRLFRSSRRER
jgi:hypothetical protein